MRVKLKLLAVGVILLSPMLVSMPAGAAAKITASPNNFSISQGASQPITLQLAQPIICPGGVTPCEVSLDLTPSDPGDVSLSVNNVIWLQSEWTQTRTVTVTAANSTTYAPSKSETIQVTIDSASGAPYYANASFNIPFTLINTNPITGPFISGQAISVPHNTSVAQNIVSGAKNNPNPSTLAIISGPSHGAASVSSGVIMYTPNSGYAGADSLTYQLCSIFDSTVCSSANVAFTVLGAPVSTSSISSPDTGYGVPGGAVPWKLSLVAIGLIITGTVLAKRNTKVPDCYAKPTKKFS